MAFISFCGEAPLFNGPYLDLFGYNADELNRKTMAEISHPEDQIVDREYFDTLLRGERDSYQMSKRFFSKDGSPLRCHMTVYLVKTTTGSVEGAAHTLIRITPGPASVLEERRLSWRDSMRTLYR